MSNTPRPYVVVARAADGQEHRVSGDAYDVLEAATSASIELQAAGIEVETILSARPDTTASRAVAAIVRDLVGSAGP